MYVCSYTIIKSLFRINNYAGIQIAKILTREHLLNMTG